MSKHTYQLKSADWLKARTRILKHATHCAICGQPLDHNAPPRSRWAPSVDHIVPRSLGGSITDPKNLRPAHYGCNSSRGNGVASGRGRRRRRPSAPRASRDW